MRFFGTVFASFYSAEMYARLRREGHYALGYSFKLVLVTTLLLVITWGYMLYQALFAAHGGLAPQFDRAILGIAKQMPTMTYHNKVLSTAEPRPYFIALDVDLFGTQERSLIATIDTTGATTRHNAETPALVTSQEIIIKKKSETRIHPLTQVLGDGQTTRIIDRAAIDGYADALIRWIYQSLPKIYAVLGLVAWLGLTLIYYVLRLCALGIITGLAVLIFSTKDVKMPIPRAMALTAVSFTPVALADVAAMMLFGESAKGLLLVIAGGAMLWAVIKATAEEQPKMK